MAHDLAIMEAASRELEPAAELVRVLLPAFGPCQGFDDTCRTAVIWDPTQGHVPRGFRGASGRVDEVRLVLVFAEPGNPYSDEEHQGKAPRDILRSAYTTSFDHLEHPRDLFARNVRLILDMAWPGHSLQEQLRRTWLTESVLCSAEGEGRSLPSRVERACAERYLVAQLKLLDNARVVALGRKAQDRLGRLGIPFVGAGAAAPPGCNFAGVRESWEEAVAGLGA